MDTKQCSKCGEIKDVGLFQKRGLICNKCKAAYARLWTRGHLDSVRATQKGYAYRKSEEIKTRRKINYLLNKEKISKQQKQWRCRHRDSIKQQRQKQRNKYAKWRKDWNERNPDKVRNTRRRIIDELADCYVVGRLVSMGFPKEFITPDLIEIQRLIIKTKRHVNGKAKSSQRYAGITAQSS